MDDMSFDANLGMAVLCVHHLTTPVLTKTVLQSFVHWSQNTSPYAKIGETAGGTCFRANRTAPKLYTLHFTPFVR